MIGFTDNQGKGVSLRQRFFSIPTLASFAIALAFMVFLTTRFDLDWGSTWDSIRSMNPWLYALASGLYYLSFVFRGLRWRALARNAAAHESPDVRLPSVGRFSHLILVGWFVNSITGLRLGDAYRAYGLSQDSGDDFSWSLGTVFAERVMDMATVFVLIFIAAVTFSASSDSAASKYVLAAAALMGLAFTVLVLLMRVYGTRLARALPGRLEEAYRRFHQGTLGSFKQLPVLFTLGLIGWILEIGRLYLVVQALGLNISLPLAMLAALGHALLSTVLTPGGLGVVEPGVTGLLVLGMTRHDAVSVVLLDRSITYVSVILVGGLFFVLLQMIMARDNRRRLVLAEAHREQESAVDG